MSDFHPKEFMKEQEDKKDPNYFHPQDFIKSLNKPAIPSATEDDVTANFLPQLPIISPLARKITSAISGLTGERNFVDEYKDTEKSLKEAEEKSRRKFPTATTATEIGGGMLLPYPGSGAATTLGKLGQFAGRLATGAGYAGAESALQDKGVVDIATDAYRGLENQFLYGEVLPQAIKTGMKYGYMPTVTGIKPKTAEKYYERNKEIRQESMPALKKDIDETVGNLRDDYLDTKRLEQEAQGNYKTQNERSWQDLKSNTKPNEGLVADILGSMDNLRKGISAQSSKAFDVLAKSGKTASIKNIRNHVASELNNLKIAGAEGQSEAVPVLKAQYDWLSSVPEDKFTFTDLKRYIQVLDEKIAGSYAKLKAPGGYLTPGDKALINYRGWIDDFYLKKIPEYAAIMEPLSKHTSLMKNVNNIIGNEKDAFNVLRNIHKPENKKSRTLIEGLGLITGKDFKKPIADYENNMALLTNKPYFDDMMKRSDEYAAANMASDVAETAKQRYEPIKNITPRTSENLIKRTYRDNAGIQAKEDLDYLSQFGKENFGRRSENLGIKEIFEKPYIQGSRNVNMFGLSGRALGNVLHGSKGDILAAIAPFYGALNDTFGRKATKAVIDLAAHPKYGKILAESATRGFNSLALTISLMSKKDPEFNAALGGDNGER